MQHGVGRTTAFVTELVSVIVSSLILAIAGTVLTAIMQLAMSSNNVLIVNDMYQLVYLSETANQVMALPDQVMSTLFSFVLFCSAQALGMFISMGYYHLNKTATVIVSIVVPLLLVFGLPYGLMAGEAAGVSIDAALWMNPWFTLVINAVAALVFMMLNWLLIRRVAIRPAKP